MKNPITLLIPPLEPEVTGMLPGEFKIEIYNRALEEISIKGYWVIDKAAIKYNIPSKLYFLQPEKKDIRNQLPTQRGILIPIDKHPIRNYISIPGQIMDENEDIKLKTIITQDGEQTIAMSPKNENIKNYLEFNIKTGEIKEIIIPTIA